MVTSFFPGRVRLRAEVFKDKDLVDKALSILKCSDAVKNVETNLRTGSVLLEYDTGKVPSQKLEELKSFFMQLHSTAIGYDGKKKNALMSMLDELEGIVKTW